jgi:hypothetical protein
MLLADFVAKVRFDAGAFWDKAHPHSGGERDRPNITGGGTGKLNGGNAKRITFSIERCRRTARVSRSRL